MIPQSSTRSLYERISPMTPLGATIAICLLVFAGCAPSEQRPSFDDLRLHEVQLIATHNSYKLEGDSGIDHVMLLTGYREDHRYDAAALKYRLAYHHLPLDVQFDLGIRSIELDVHADPHGGAYAEPGGYKAMAKFGIEPNTPFDPQGVMHTPGFKVLHVPDWDFMSSCLTLDQCLTTMRSWSEQHPTHFPILVRINIKEKTMPVIADAYPPTVVPKFSAETFRALDAQIIDTLGSDRVLLAEEIRGTWPTVGATRGKFIFSLLGGQRFAQRYLDALDDAQPQLMLTRSRDAAHPPLESFSQAKLRSGAKPSRPDALVFARTETRETREARENDTSLRDAAFASRANVLITDFPTPDPRFSDYRVRFPDRTFVRPHPSRSRGALRAEFPSSNPQDSPVPTPEG